ncbi:hypothetical protein PUNSTDRAFT_60850 [Punctularia strigosozonata HHB-11173 SS5]|uniref:uncharacterized protein n=1 Tax=Punctularia strigosozonata (strain HHB-11173) TaxID=741275 RepID=UPI0004417AFF|nr:uncharacterized protein PUNSTDRAFT_60850 [Punctularia strigosozonata HHB-11173 SS5]EIN12323.1 hypothetical protein PUNSTDRAFT_60850 [Punctularia strigosozonata HHB-11173 SS5]
MTANLRPPSGAGSRSPSPGPEGGRPANARASMGPNGASARPQGMLGAPLASPRPGGARPTSELLVNNVNYQSTPEAEAIDQWFENLQSYEDTLVRLERLRAADAAC